MTTNKTELDLESQPISTAASPFKQWIPIILIMVLATTLYLYRLGTESLWIDELISIQRAKNLDRIFQDTRPLYHALLAIWMQVSTNDAWLRGLGVLCGLGTVLLTYQLGRRLLGESVGLIAALLVAFSPLLMHHAQEVRMYALNVCMGVGGTLAMSYALQRPTPAAMRWWAGLRALAILTTPLSLLLLGADAILFGWRFRQQPHHFISFIKGLLLIGILWLPFGLTLILYAGPAFMGGVHVPGEVAEVRNAPPPGLFDVYFQFTRFTTWGFGRPNSEAIYWFYKAYAGVLIGLLGVTLLPKSRSSAIGWLAVWAFFPLTIFFTVSQLSRSLWVDRYLVLAIPYVLILVAAGLVQVWQRWRWVAVAIACIHLVAIGGGLKRYYTTVDREDWRGIVHILSTQPKANDVIVWSFGGVVVNRAPIEHYYQGSVPITLKHPPSPTSPETEKAVLEQWVRTLPTTSSQLWLVSVRSSPTFLSVLEEHFTIEEHKHIRPVQIYVLTPRL
jgi:4-amino-4-deoxy-L-arabinose transferase-like glycosyltransferase